eukprot:Gb_17555 [translate_table: standard]
MLPRQRAYLRKVNSVKFNEYGAAIISAGYDRTVRAWDCRSHSTEPIQTIDTFSDSVMSVCLTKTEILAGSVDGTIRTFDIRIGREIVDDLGQSVNCISTSNDNNCILASCLDSTLRLLDRSTGELLQEYKGHVCKEEYPFLHNIDQVITLLPFLPFLHHHAIHGLHLVCQLFVIYIHPTYMLVAGPIGLHLHAWGSGFINLQLPVWDFLGVYPSSSLVFSFGLTGSLTSSLPVMPFPFAVPTFPVDHILPPMAPLFDFGCTIGMAFTFSGSGLGISLSIVGAVVYLPVSPQVIVSTNRASHCWSESAMYMSRMADGLPC